MIITINHRNYIDLLDRVEIVPKVIEIEIEYDRFLVVVEELLAKRQSRTPEETALFVLLVKLIEDYEREHYSIDDGVRVPPHRAGARRTDRDGGRDGPAVRGRRFLQGARRAPCADHLE